MPDLSSQLAESEQFLSTQPEHASTSAVSPQHSTIAVYLALVFCGGIWGLVPTLAKTALASGAHPIGLTWWQAVGGGVMVLLITTLRGRRLPLDRQHLKFYAVCGLVGTVTPTVILFYAAAHVSAGLLAVLMAAVAIMAYPLALAVKIDQLRWLRSTGLGLGLVGVALLVLPGAEAGRNDPRWVLIALLIPLGYAIENVFVAVRSPRQTDTITLVSGMLLMAGVLITPVVIVTDTWYAITWPLDSIEFAVIGIFLINVLSYVTFLWLIYAAGPVFASMSGYSAVLTGILWGMFLLEESHDRWFWIALVCMLIGMALVRERSTYGAD